jgi:hypothetical protein
MGKKLKVANKFKYLGVIMTSDLWWSVQVNAAANKVNRILDLIMIRTVRPMDSKTFSMLYKSLVRPILEYAMPVWSPYLLV